MSEPLCLVVKFAELFDMLKNGTQNPQKAEDPEPFKDPGPYDDSEFFDAGA